MMSQRKDPELDAKHQSILRKMMQMPENKSCADCKGPSPRWASTNLGIFVCIACSGIHRKLGTHISQVRSTTLDTWTPAQIAHFQKLGNGKAAQYFEACIPADFRRPLSSDATEMERFIRQKYESKRFISVENGGLGGVALTTSSRRTPNPNSFSGDQVQMPSRSNRLRSSRNPSDQRNSRNNALPLNYVNRFRSEKPFSGPSRRPSNPNAIVSNSGSRLGVRPGSALQRAATLKEITNMGFPVHLAARAVEASDGDLQRAVDWVLENNTDRDSRHSDASSVTQSAVQIDLLSIGDPEPVSAKTTVGTNPRKDGSAVNKLVMPETDQVPRSVFSDFADFADFGAFESAVPITSAPLKANPSTGTNPLGTSLASLYTQGPVKGTARECPPSPAKAAYSLPQLPKVETPSHLKAQPGNTHNVLLSSQEDQSALLKKSAQFGVRNDSIPSFTWPASLPADSPVRTKSKTEVTQKTAEAKDLFSISQVTFEPPPQLPTGWKNTEGDDETPPPPACPPPRLEERVAVRNVVSHPQQERQNSTEDGSMEKEGKQGENDDARGSIEVKEEDPFAALSMFAMNSAISSARPSSAEKTVQDVSKDPPNADAPKPTVQDKGSAADFSLDDLLG